MLFLIVCLYLIVGIIICLPLIVIGLREDPSKIEELDEFDGFGKWVSLSIGGLFAIIIWPYWIGYILWKTYISDD